MSGTGIFDLDSIRDRKASEYRNNATRNSNDGKENDDGDITVQLRRESLTVILQVSNIRADAEVHRQIGVNDAMTFTSLHDVLVACFDLPREESPWHFYQTPKGRRGQHKPKELARIDPEHQLAEFLWCEGSVVDFTWGLWDFRLKVAGIYSRDSKTPQALCVGGSGSFPGSKFDLTSINAELTGKDVIDEVLTYLTVPARSVIERSRLFDFVPLLQALDLSRDVELTGKERRLISTLPREVTSEGNDAFWSVVLGLSCLGTKELMSQVTATTMAALGWIDDNGEELTAAEVWDMCSASADILESLNACGPDAAAPVDRLDIFRAILRGVG